MFVWKTSSIDQLLQVAAFGNLERSNWVIIGAKYWTQFNYCNIAKLTQCRNYSSTLIFLNNLPQEHKRSQIYSVNYPLTSSFCCSFLDWCIRLCSCVNLFTKERRGWGPENKRQFLVHESKSKWWNFKEMRQGPKEQMCQQEGWSGTIWDFSVKKMDFDTLFRDKNYQKTSSWFEILVLELFMLISVSITRK